MSEENPPHNTQRMAIFRLSAIGELLAHPPQHRGELAQKLDELAKEEWVHPVTKKLCTIGRSTLETWYYAVRDELDPLNRLRHKVRSDCGQHPSMPPALQDALRQQYAQHRNWSYQLHYDNLMVTAEQKLKLEGDMPCYSSVYRYMKQYGLWRRRRRGPQDSPGGQVTEARMDTLETRSYEAPAVNALWHVDFHQTSRKVLLPDGSLGTPELLGIIDDFSRLGCHLQWYLIENSENFVHGFCQAAMKRGLCRSLMDDRGGAFFAAEVTEGLTRLSILQNPTLAYHPEANAKIEKFWQQVEQRLMAMLEGTKNLTLDQLNVATQAWLEMEYNRKVHQETGETPLDRFLHHPNLARECPSADALRQAFTATYKRKQRKTDGTICVKGVRFEIPNAYRTLNPVHFRFARWNLAYVYLIDPRTDQILCRLFPLDKAANSDGRRRTLSPLLPAMAQTTTVQPDDEMAPLLKQLMADYAATGLPPAYLPQVPSVEPEETADE